MFNSLVYLVRLQIEMNVGVCIEHVAYTVVPNFDCFGSCLPRISYYLPIFENFELHLLRSEYVQTNV